MSQPLYSVGIWDIDKQSYVPCRLSVPSFNMTLPQLRQAVRELRYMGYSAHRRRDPNGDEGHFYDDNDFYVLIERTDGKHWKKIRKGWQR